MGADTTLYSFEVDGLDAATFAELQARLAAPLAKLRRIGLPGMKRV